MNQNFTFDMKIALCKRRLSLQSFWPHMEIRLLGGNLHLELLGTLLFVLLVVEVVDGVQLFHSGSSVENRRCDSAAGERDLRYGAARSRFRQTKAVLRSE